MSAIDIISQSVETCIKENIIIVRGPFFVWDGPRFYQGDPLNLDRPCACNGLGAVLWTSGLARSPGNWKALQKVLDEDEFFLYRFCLGWDRGKIISIVNKEDKEIGQDSISKQAKALAKRYVNDK